MPGIRDEFWAPRIEVNRAVSIWHCFERLNDPGDFNVSKLTKGAAYMLAKQADAKLHTYAPHSARCSHSKCASGVRMPCRLFLPFTGSVRVAPKLASPFSGYPSSGASAVSRVTPKTHSQRDNCGQREQPPCLNVGLNQPERPCNCGCYGGSNRPVITDDEVVPESYESDNVSHKALL
jgi:hypothetical protein